uniref:Chromosome 12 open reading frame 56 n=1 Tax=Vombatus ursinus TaxID=29139 RepID=A0A4X2M1P5_VOMUR
MTWTFDFIGAGNSWCGNPHHQFRSAAYTLRHLPGDTESLSNLPVATQLIRSEERSEPRSSLHQYYTHPFSLTLGHGSERTKLPNGDQNAFRTLPIPSKRSCSPISILSYTANTKEFQTPSDQKNSQSEIQFKFSGNGNDFYSGNVASSVILPNNPNLEKKESELHLYIISTTSPMFLHLKSSWNNYMIVSALFYASLPLQSEEMIKLFTQLKSELFLKDNTLGRIACLLAELKVAAQRNFIFRKLFWKTSDLYYFLVSKLHEYLPKPQDPKALQNKSQRADQLEACIQILQTLVLMFRETETELSRLNTLAAKKGTLITLLIILISEPEIPKSCPVFGIQFVTDSSLVEMSFDAEVRQNIFGVDETCYIGAFFSQDLGLGSRKFAISWIMSLLQSFPPTISFVASIVKQVMKGLLMSLPLLSPGQAVLLYQQFYIIKSCLQHSSILAEYIRNNHKEEFRYFVHMPALEKRLPLCYPITQTTTKLIHEVLDLVEQEQCVKCS